MKMLYEIIKIFYFLISFVWFILCLRYFHERPKKDDIYHLLLAIRKDLRRLCFFSFILGVIAFILTCFEFYFKIKLQFNLAGFFCLIAYIVCQIGLNKLNKKIEEEEKLNNSK